MQQRGGRKSSPLSSYSGVWGIVYLEPDYPVLIIVLGYVIGAESVAGLAPNSCDDVSPNPSLSSLDEKRLDLSLKFCTAHDSYTQSNTLASDSDNCIKRLR